LHFSHRIPWKFVDYDQIARVFEAGQAFSNSNLHRLNIRELARFCHDHTQYSFTEIRVWHADHGAFQNTSLIIKNQFDFLGVDVVTA